MRSSRTAVPAAISTSRACARAGCAGRSSRCSPARPAARGTTGCRATTGCSSSSPRRPWSTRWRPPTRPRSPVGCSRSSGREGAGCPVRSPISIAPHRTTGRRWRSCTSKAPRRSTRGLEALELWYAAGLRSVGPVWSRPNAFAHGVPFISPSSPDTGPGLTDAGRALVRRCGELGIMIDVSHLNEAGFWDVAALDVGPIVATTRPCTRCAATSRNLTDAQLDAIGGSGGLVGIVFACPFLRADFADDPDTPLSLIAQHARYVADRIGVGPCGAWIRLRRRHDPGAARGRGGTPKLLDALAAAGFRRRRARRSPGTTGAGCSAHGGGTSKAVDCTGGRRSAAASNRAPFSAGSCHERRAPGGG